MRHSWARVARVVSWYFRVQGGLVTRTDGSRTPGIGVESCMREQGHVRFPTSCGRPPQTNGGCTHSDLYRLKSGTLGGQTPTLQVGRLIASGTQLAKADPGSLAQVRPHSSCACLPLLAAAWWVFTIARPWPPATTRLCCRWAQVEPTVAARRHGQLSLFPSPPCAFVG